MKTLTSLLSLFFSLNASAFASSDPEGVYGYLPDTQITIGKGFAAKTPLRDFPLCLSNFKTVPLNGGPVNEETTVEAKIVKGSEELKEVLGIDGSLDASYLTSKVTATFSNTSTREINSHSINVVIVGKSKFGGYTLDQTVRPTSHRLRRSSIIGSTPPSLACAVRSSCPRSLKGPLSRWSLAFMGSRRSKRMKWTFASRDPEASAR